MENMMVRSAYDTLKGALTAMPVDNLRFSYLMHQLDFLYEQLLSLADSVESFQRSPTGSASTASSGTG